RGIGRGVLDASVASSARRSVDYAAFRVARSANYNCNCNYLTQRTQRTQRKQRKNFWERPRGAARGFPGSFHKHPFSFLERTAKGTRVMHTAATANRFACRRVKRFVVETGTHHME